MHNYYIVATALNKLEIASRNMSGSFTTMFVNYLKEVRSYKDYNFSNDLASRITSDAQFAERKLLAS